MVWNTTFQPNLRRRSISGYPARADPACPPIPKAAETKLRCRGGLTCDQEQDRSISAQSHNRVSLRWPRRRLDICKGETEGQNGTRTSRPQRPYRVWGPNRLNPRQPVATRTNNPPRLRAKRRQGQRMMPRPSCPGGRWRRTSFSGRFSLPTDSWQTSPGPEAEAGQHHPGGVANHHRAAGASEEAIGDVPGRDASDNTHNLEEGQHIGDLERIHALLADK